MNKMYKAVSEWKPILTSFGEVESLSSAQDFLFMKIILA